MDQLFSDAMDKISNGELDISGLFQTTGILMSSGHIDNSSRLYKAWIDANPDSQVLYAIYFNYGVSLQTARNFHGAAESYLQAIRLNPRFAPPYINPSFVYETLGGFEPAVETLQVLLNILSPITEEEINHKATALKQIARLLDTKSRSSKVEDALRQSILINQNQRDIVQHFINTRMFLCKWPTVVSVGKLSKNEIVKIMAPLTMACYTDDPLLQLSSSYYYNRYDIKCPDPIGIAGSWLPPNANVPKKLRIGYVSSDLYGHAVGYLVTEAFELHNRDNVEVFIYYWGTRIPDGASLRVMAAADTWRDIHELSDKQAAALIVKDEIDVLVDLNGHTSSARTSIFAYRPAPIIVNWLGFPGTMGSFHHSYIIADDYIIPESHEHYYSEKVMRLPCYQPNDRKRIISTSHQSRIAERLPENAFVYCCFNGVQKLTKFTFERWMKILHNVPNSVLWMLDGGAEANGNLISYAENLGISPGRIIIAPKIANYDHLARYPLADLFLDSSPYGAHTTASDALWMGVPILTVPGRSFASRVCASLIHAAGMDELICENSDIYVARAIELGKNIDLVRSYKDKIARNRDTCPLFNTTLLVRELENIYRQMWGDYCNNSMPKINIKNCYAYHEIGSKFDHDELEMLAQPHYESLYKTMIEHRMNYISFMGD